VDRIACVDLNELPLQLLLRREPAWRGGPVAVVDRENAQGVILWVNESARARKILPGMRYAPALSLSRELRAGAVPEKEIERGVTELAGRLRRFTAEVEPSNEEPGVFWLSASGLSLLFPSLREWAALVHRDMTEAGFRASVAVGFSRFGTYAISKSIDGAAVFESVEDERARARKVPIDRLGFDPRLRDALSKLGITTLGDFLALPAPAVRKRFGNDVHRLHQLANDGLFAPLQPELVPEPASGAAVFDYPESDLDRLMAVVAQLLEPILAALSKRDRLVTALVVQFVFDDRGRHRERVEPAGRTLDLEQLLDLVRLRFEGVSLSSGVAEVELEAESAPASREQRDLFEAQSPRDLSAANRALARIRAELGDGAVVRARLREGHLPEASFEWEPLKRVDSPSPRSVALRPLVRRIYSRPVALSRRRQREPRTALVTLVEDRLVEERAGPYIISGGWWVREVGREYYFVRTETGRCLWLYYDRRRQCWFLQGEVE
jgi:protein ImuB